MVDFCAGVLPVGKVNAEDVRQLKEECPEGLLGDPVRKALCKANADSVGFPVAVQVVTPPYREELNLTMMRLIEQHCRE